MISTGPESFFKRPRINHPSLSKNPGSFWTRLSNFAHQSWKLLRGTTSTPFAVFPAKLARKLNAFWMIRWASTRVSGGLFVTVSEVADADDCSWSWAICAWIFCAGSTEMPRLTSPPTFPATPSRRFTRNKAEGFSLPMAPRNLNPDSPGSCM